MIGDVSQNNKIHAYILFFICIMKNRNNEINLSIYITTRLVDLSVLLISLTFKGFIRLLSVPGDF